MHRLCCKHAVQITGPFQAHRSHFRRKWLSLRRFKGHSTYTIERCQSPGPGSFNRCFQRAARIQASATADTVESTSDYRSPAVTHESTFICTHGILKVRQKCCDACVAQAMLSAGISLRRTSMPLRQKSRSIEGKRVINSNSSCYSCCHRNDVQRKLLCRWEEGGHFKPREDSQKEPFIISM